MGCVNPPTGQYRGTWQNSSTGDVSRTNTTHLGDVSVQDQLGVESRYRANLRALTGSTDTTAGDASLEQTETVLQPSVDLVLAFAALQWVQGYEIFENQVQSSQGFDNDQTRTDVLQKLIWSPANLPRVTAWVDVQERKDDISLDTRDARWVLEVDDRRGPFTLDYRAELRNRSDDLSDTERDQVEHILRATYREDHLDGQLMTSASVFVDERDATDSFPTSGGPPIPPDQIFPAAGLSLVDASPAAATLQPTPALIDGDDSTPTGINIGGLAAGGEDDWNIGVEFPQDSSTTLVLLYTDEAVGPVFLPQYGFSVWSSDDNSLWTQVSGNVAFTYESAFRRFRIFVPEVEARYLKLVTTQTSPLAPAIFVTEIETFGPGADSGTAMVGSTERDDSVRNATTNLTWRPDQTLSFGADVFAQTQERLVDGEANQDEQRLDLGLNALWTPTRLMDLSLRALSRNIDDPARFDQDYLQLTGLLTFHPVDTLDLSLNYLDTNQDRDGDDERDNTAARVRASAQLLKTLTADLSYEHNILDDFLNERRTERDIITATAIAEMTRDVDLRLELVRDEADVTGPGAGVAPDPSSTRAAVLAVYQPSNQLTTEVRLQWRDDTGGAGLDQRYRINWLPFPDGSIDLRIDYLHTVDGVLEEGNDIYRLIGRWNITPSAFFQLGWSVDIPDNAERTDLLSASFILTV